MLRILAKEVGKPPEERMIENNLGAMQALVGGYIQAVPWGTYILVCNEEGKLNSLDANFRIGNDMIVGDAFFVRAGSEEFTSLTDADVEHLKNAFEFIN